MRLIILTAIIAMAIPATAGAARPSLTQHTADTEARHALDRGLGAADDWSGVYGATPVSYEIDPCELDRRRAECDFTMRFSDGDECDGTVTVQRTRRGRLVSDMTLDYCDSDGDTK